MDDTEALKLLEPPAQPASWERTTSDVSAKLLVAPKMFQRDAEDMMKKGVHMKGYEDPLKNDMVPKN